MECGKMRSKIVFIYICTLLVLVFDCSAVDLTADQERVAQNIFSTTMSPYCPGRLLSDCPSNSASELKENLRTRVAAGESEGQIELYLESIYGQGIHALPPTRGFGLVAWLTPVLFLGVGLLIFKIWIKRNNKKLDKTIDEPSSTADWNEEIDRQLKE
jgi:cytochrome c-type biogenesis protein CcmH